MNQKTRLTHSALAVAVALFSSNIHAAGFQLNEFSASALGRAFSGEGAIADNAASGSRNPATMTKFSSTSLSGGFTYIDPKVDIQGTSPLTRQSTSANDIAPSEWVPNLHLIVPIDDKWAVGASVTSNFGLSTKFNDDYPAGPLGGKTELRTLNTNLSAAYRLNQHFSFGLGVNAVYADAEINRTAGDLSTANILPVSPGTRIHHLKGDKWGYGWNTGILYEMNEDTRFGLTYRSKVDIKFDGTYNGVSSNFQDVPGKLTLNLPEIWEFSGYTKVAPQWAMHYGMAYTRWSAFQELKATGNNGNVLFEKHEGFTNAYRMALGTTYYHDSNWTFRTGIAFDESPIPANNRTISIPDQNRFWFSAGTTYAFNQAASVDLGIAYMHGQKVTIKEQINPALPAYEFDSKGSAMLYALNLNYTF